MARTPEQREKLVLGPALIGLSCVLIYPATAHSDTRSVVFPVICALMALGVMMLKQGMGWTGRK